LFNSVAECGFIVGYSVVYLSLGVDVFGTVGRQSHIRDTGFSSDDAEICTREFIGASHPLLSLRHKVHDGSF